MRGGKVSLGINDVIDTRRTEGDSALPIKTGGFEITRLLKEFNLTRLESDIYIGLLRGGESKAKDLSQQLGINRVDVYRVLKRLLGRGLVSVTPSDPAVYDAVHPRIALKALVGEVEGKARRMREIAPEVALELETLGKRPRATSPSSSNEGFKLLRGEPAVNEAKQIIARAENTLQAVWSIKRILKIDAIETILGCVKRGVKTQVVCELTKGCVGISEVEELVQRGNIRHCDGIDHSLRFTVTDGREAILGATTIDSDVRNDMSLWSGRKELVQLLSAQFQILWNKSEDGKERMMRLASEFRRKR